MWTKPEKSSLHQKPMAQSQLTWSKTEEEEGKSIKHDIILPDVSSETQSGSSGEHMGSRVLHFRFRVSPSPVCFIPPPHIPHLISVSLNFARGVCLFLLFFIDSSKDFDILEIGISLSLLELGKNHSG